MRVWEAVPECGVLDDLDVTARRSDKGMLSCRCVHPSIQRSPRCVDLSYEPVVLVGVAFEAVKCIQVLVSQIKHQSPHGYHVITSAFD
jgi:hypothetical protein